MFAGLKENLSDFVQHLTTKKGDPNGFAEKEQVPPLTRAHLSDRSGLTINEAREIVEPPVAVFKRLLERHEGVVIKKLKRSLCDIEFLTDNMQELAELGVRKLYCNFIDKVDQELLDRFHYGEEVSSEIKKYITEKYGKEQRGVELTTRAELCLRVMRAADTFGIKTIASDLSASSDKSQTEAIRISNHIKKWDGEFAGKSIVCAGAEDNLAELAQLLSMPEIYALPTDKRDPLVMPGPDMAYSMFIPLKLADYSISPGAIRDQLLESDRRLQKLRNG